MKTNRPEDPFVAPPGSRSVRPRAAEWEHKQIVAAEETNLAPYAQGGWELVAIVPLQNRHGWIAAYFKRPLQSSANRPMSEQG